MPTNLTTIKVYGGQDYFLKPGEKNLFARLPHWFKEQDYEWARKVYAAIISVQHPDAIKHYLDPVASQQKWRDELNVLYNFAHTWYQRAAGKAIYRMFNLPPHGNYFDLAWNLLVRGVKLSKLKQEEQKWAEKVKIAENEWEKLLDKKHKTQEVISRVKGGEGERFEAWLEKFLKISISMEQERRRIKEETKIRESNLREEERRNITRSFMQIDNEGNVSDFPFVEKINYRFMEPWWYVDRQKFLEALEDKYFAHLNEPVPKVISKDIPKYKDKKIKALVIDIFNEWKATRKNRISWLGFLLTNRNKTPIVKDYDKGQYELSRTERLPSFGSKIVKVSGNVFSKTKIWEREC